MRLLKPVLFLSVLFSFSYAINCSLVQNVKKWGEHYYTITANRLTWQQAVDFARESGGYLAIPNSAAENEFLKSLIPTPKYAWIGVYDPSYMSNYCYEGGSCLYDDSRFRDIKGNALTYTNWAYKQPDNLVKTYDIVNGKQMVSPLGEHWVAMSSLNGKWADFGNHADEYNNPVKFYALIEFDKMPDCYTPESNATDTYSGAKCNTQIYDSTTGTLSNGETYNCIQDPNGVYYCPAGLAPCGETWDYKDSYSVKKRASYTTTLKKVRIWIGKIGNNYWSGWCTIYHLSTSFYVKDVKKVISFFLKRAKFDDYIMIKLNGHILRVGPYGGDRLNIVGKYLMKRVEYANNKYGACELKTSWDQVLKINAKPYLVNGINKIDIYVEVAGKGEGYAYFEGVVEKTDTITCSNSYCSIEDIGEVNETSFYTYYEYLCSGTNEYGEPYEPIDSGGDCNPTSEDDLIDTDGDGVPDSCNSPTPPPNNCKAKSFTCVPAPDRKCVYVDNKWQCSPYPCFGEGAGDYNVTNADTPVGINDANNNGWNSDGSCSGTLYIFNGKDMRCRSDDAFFGLTGGGCCNKDKVFLGLVECKEDEKILARKNDNGMCHYIGEYCSKKLKFLGGSVCVQHKKTYCCFNSKLARIINEQGRPQLGKNWGDAKHPNCRGFTPEEFQKLDFSKMDLSEFYNSISQNISQSVLNNMTQYIQNSLQNQLNNVSP